MEKFPYEYFQNLEKLEQAIQAIKFDLTELGRSRPSSIGG